MFALVTEILGPWTWIVVALILLGIEILLPSTFILWPGLAALVVGTITLLVGLNNPAWPWHIQVLVFLVLSIAFALIGRRMMKNKNFNASENPTLNSRMSQYVGRTCTLTDPIVQGRGRVTMGDTTWVVTGPDAPKGSAVKIVGYEANTFRVETV